MAFLTMIILSSSTAIATIAVRRKPKQIRLASWLIDGASKSDTPLTPKRKSSARDTQPLANVLLSSTQHQEKDAIIARTQEESGIATKQFRRNFAIMSVGLAAAAVGGIMAVPAFLLFSVGCQLYCLVGYYQDAYQALVREKRLTVSVLDSVILTGSLLGGFVVTAAIANWLVAVTRLMMAYTEDHSMQQLVEVFGEQPHHVWVWIDGNAIEIPFEQIKPSATIVVHTGHMIPIDGMVTSGVGLVDQQRLTGESQPVEKRESDEVFASTILLSGRLFIHVEKAGTETLVAKITETLGQTMDHRMALQSDAIAFVDKMTAPTMLVSSLALPFAGLSGALAILWNVPGYRMMFFGPLNMLTYLHIASRSSILIKDGRSLDMLRDVNTIIFDKTGTLTLEQPHIAQIHVFNGITQDELLLYVASAEQHQTHPIAKAILHEADRRELSLYMADDTHYTLGNGIKAHLNGKVVHVGSKRFMESETISIPDEAKAIEAWAYAQGFSVVMAAIDNQLVGVLELRSTIRPEARETIAALRARGMDLYIISGDYEAPTRFLANELEIPNYFAQVLPEGKADLIKQLQEEGRSVCFIGDGINDSIALKQANVSVSIAGATTIATDTAHIILMQGTLTQLNAIFDIVEQYTNDLNTYYKATIIPGVFCTIGTFMLGWGFLTAVLVAQGCFLLALGKVIQTIRQNDPKEMAFVNEPSAISMSFTSEKFDTSVISAYAIDEDVQIAT